MEPCFAIKSLLPSQVGARLSHLVRRATATDYAATGEALTLYFVPAADFNGTASFTYAAKDDGGASDATPATATITVTPVNDAPTTDTVAASGAEDAASIAVVLSGSDIDGTVQSFILTGDANANVLERRRGSRYLGRRRRGDTASYSGSGASVTVNLASRRSSPRCPCCRSRRPR